MEILFEYLGEILLGLELILLKIFGKTKTEEEIKQARLAKLEKKAAKAVAKADADLVEIEKIKKGG